MPKPELMRAPSTGVRSSVFLTLSPRSVKNSALFAPAGR